MPAWLWALLGAAAGIGTTVLLISPKKCRVWAIVEDEEAADRMVHNLRRMGTAPDVQTHAGWWIVLLSEADYARAAARIKRLEA